MLGVTEGIKFFLRFSFKVYYGRCYKGSFVLIKCFGCFENRVIFLSRWIFLKEVVLSWVLKDILDLMGREGEMGENILGGENRVVEEKVWGLESL